MPRMTPDEFDAKVQDVFAALTSKSAPPLAPSDREALSHGLEAVIEVGCALIRIADAAETIARDGIGHKRAAKDPLDGL